MHVHVHSYSRRHGSKEKCLTDGIAQIKTETRAKEIEAS